MNCNPECIHALNLDGCGELYCGAVDKYIEDVTVWECEWNQKVCEEVLTTTNEEGEEV